MQLELGSVATTFERRSYALELALCQAYTRLAPLTRLSGYTAGVQNVITSTTWPDMRAAPTLTLATYSQTGATGASLSGITARGASFSAATAGAGAYDIYVLTGLLSAEL